MDIKFADKANWDSYGGAPTTQVARDRVDQLAVRPSGHGGCEVHVAGCEIEIGPDGKLRSFVWDGPEA